MAKNKSANFTFIRYANCWEDTNILLSALKIKTDEVGLSIASGGDNTLAMLIKNPKKIYAIDLNKTQLYVTEYKMAAIRALSYNDTLKLLGVNKSHNRKALYRKIRPCLSNVARKYFDEHPKLVEQGIIHTGKFEHFFFLFRKYIIPLVSSTKKFQTFARLDDLARQEEFFQKYINTRRYRMLFHVFFSAKVMGKLGRDKNFYNYVKDKNSQAEDIEKRVQFGVSNSINQSNPYLNYIAYGNYQAESLPLYLRPENYKAIKQNLDRIKLVNGDLSSIKSLNIDFFNLSDIFEYMSEEAFEENIQTIEKISAKNARIAYWNQQNRRYINSNKFKLDKKSSTDLFRQNQSWFYRDFCLYLKK